MSKPTEDLKKDLQEPIEKLNGSNVQETFKGIAKKLFENYYIQCGEKKYYFAEIEFYYYEKEKLCADWNRKTYPRTDKQVGDFFFHYSGFDICFESCFDKGKFGGILVRSLRDEKGNFITGPLVCLLEILNACAKLKIWPELVHSQEQECCDLAEPIARCGITYKDNQEDMKLCYYDKRLLETEPSTQKVSWNFTKKQEITSLRYYKRFNNK